MVILQAPHEIVQTTIFLPDPEFGDEVALTSTAPIRRAMDGTIYSYPKRTNKKRFTFEFQLERLATLQLEEFLTNYATQNIRITDHRDRVWVAKLVTDSLEVTVIKRTEICQVSLEFEGSIFDG